MAPGDVPAGIDHHHQGRADRQRRQGGRGRIGLRPDDDLTHRQDQEERPDEFDDQLLDHDVTPEMERLSGSSIGGLPGRRRDDALGRIRIARPAARPYFVMRDGPRRVAAAEQSPRRSGGHSRIISYLVSGRHIVIFSRYETWPRLAAYLRRVTTKIQPFAPSSRCGRQDIGEGYDDTICPLVARGLARDGSRRAGDASPRFERDVLPILRAAA